MHDLVFPLLLLFLTYLTGSFIEKRHFKNIQQREIRLISKPIINSGSKKWESDRPVKTVKLVTGEAVISGDYFKTFVAYLKNFFGFQLTPLESVMDRARREAILRMREKAKNADIIVNTRIESIMLNNIFNKNSVPKCAIIAYGTAITYEK